MRASLQLAALAVILSFTHCRAALRLRGRPLVDGGDGDGGDEGSSEGNRVKIASIETRSSSSGSSSSSTPPNAGETKSSPAKVANTKFRLPGQQTRRERRCAEAEVEECGQGLGHLLCEYNEEQNAYATRCVRKTKASLHLQLHPNNYCGTCRRCFEHTDELRQAVIDYVANSTKHTSVAQNYGWPINKWCVSMITDFSNVFANQRKFKESVADWDVSRAVNMSGIFQSAYLFNGDVSTWQVGNVQDMSQAFDCAYTFNQPLETWNTKKVKSMKRMFRVAKAFDQDLSTWETGNVKDTSYMFYRAHSFQSPVMQNSSHFQDMSYMFAFTRRFNHSSIGDWDVARAQTLRGAFQNTGAFDQDLSRWNVDRVVDTSFMFYRASSFDDERQQKIVSSWDLSNVAAKEDMFSDAQAALNGTTAAQEDAAMLSHPSYDGSRITQGLLDLAEATSGASNSNNLI